jgi:cytochrome c553
MRCPEFVVAAFALFAAGGTAEPSARLRYGMRQRFADLRTIERQLIQGDLEAARPLAFMLTRPTHGEPRAPEAAEVTLTAAALADAPTVEDALRAEVRVASACAACHEAHAASVLRRPTRVPADRPTLAAQMARHQWAADRLWEGIVAPDDDHWTSGLYVLANTNMPVLDRDGPQLAKKLRDQAAAAYRQRRTDHASRAKTYGDLLVTCWGCHAGVRAR